MTAAAACEELLCVALDGGASEAWLQCADVLAAPDALPHPAAVRLAGAVLLRYPGCLVSVVRRAEGGFVLGLRVGGSGSVSLVVVLREAGPSRPGGRAAASRRTR